MLAIGAKELQVRNGQSDGEADAFISPIKYDDFQLVEEDNHLADGAIPAWRFKKMVRR